MNDHLAEIIFKNIQKNKIGNALEELTSQGKEVLNYNITCGSFDISWKNKHSIEDIFNNFNNFGLFINLNELKNPYIYLPKCSIAVYKFEEKINFEINFKLMDLEDISIKNIATKLMELSKLISNQYEIEEYYCGFEPAEEQQTRLFTNKGPDSLFYRVCNDQD